MTFRDKFNNKTNKGKKEEDKFVAFDETSLRIHIVGGQTQLCPIKLNCVWEKSDMGMRTPELHCNWFNKTIDSIIQISNVNGSYYQPCFEDIGKIIMIQCMPHLQNKEYEGMPIAKQIGPIKLDPQTEQQANQLLSCGKATFLIKIISQQGSNIYYEGLLKVTEGSLKLVKKDKLEQQLAQCEFKDKTFKYEICRFHSKKIKLIFSSQKYYEIEFNNNKIRDVFLLLNRLIALKQIDEIHEQANVMKISEDTTLPEKSQKSQQAKKESFQKSIDELSSKISSKKSESSEVKKQIICETTKQQSLQNSEEVENINVVKSEGDFIQVKVQKIQPQHQQQQNKKKNSQALIQIGDLKQKIKELSNLLALQKQNSKISKSDLQTMKNEIEILKERQINFSHNYNLLEEEVKNKKQEFVKTLEEMVYYKNECRIIKLDKEQMERKSNQLSQRVLALSERLKVYEENDSSISYSDLLAELQAKRREKKQIIDSLQYQKRNGRKLQQIITQLQNQLQKQQDATNFYKRKFQSLQNQITKNPNIEDDISESLVSSPTLSKNRTELSEGSFSHEIDFSEANNKVEDKIQYMQNSILSLKKQLKSAIEENNFLRSIAGGKSKSKDSKTHLKMQLMEMKKIVNKLTETLTEKDLVLEQMRKVNKEMSQKMMEMGNMQ